MKCPICEKSIDTEESLTKHIVLHGSQSILNNQPTVQKSSNLQISISESIIKPLDLEKIFGVEKFETMVKNKINQIESIPELVNRRNFIEQIKKIIKKHPFVYPLYFIEDLFHGEDSKVLLEKYYVTNYLELQNIIQQILKLEGDRYRLRLYANAFEMNLKIHTWAEKYNRFKENCHFFKDELLQLFFSNIVRSFIMIILTDYVETGIEKEEIITKSMALKDSYDLFAFIDKELARQFDRFFNSTYENLVLEIIFELIDDHILKKNETNSKLLVGEVSIDTIKKNIIDELRVNSGNIKETTLRSIIGQKYQSLKIIPGNRIWTTALKELETEKIIDFESKSNFRNDTLILLNESYQKLQSDLEILENSPPKFYGRKIAPWLFIDELSLLKKGDFGDDDDQITRIAGLVLAESVKLQPPKENIPKFDFSINIKDYHFRKEQLEAISKLNFKINSEVFHCKVMLDERFTIDDYKSIKKNLPPNEQGVVFTFRDIPKEVKQKLSKDSSIQVIDEEGVKTWVSITSVIPSRKNAVAILHNDPISKLDKKIVMINLIDYGKGMAYVSIFPEMNQALVLIRSLEEITLEEYSDGDIYSLSLKYLEFLHLLFACSPDKFEEGIFETHASEINWDNLQLSPVFNCGCYHSMNQEHSYTFCKHLVSAINSKAVDSHWFKNWDSKGNSLHKRLRIFLAKSIESTVDKIDSTLDSESSIIFKKYLTDYANFV